MVYSKHKTLPDGTKDTLIIVVNVDPHGTRESTVPGLAGAGVGPENFTHNGRFMVDDLLTGESWEWGSTTTSAWTRMSSPHTFLASGGSASEFQPAEPQQHFSSGGALN